MATLNLNAEEPVYTRPQVVVDSPMFAGTPVYARTKTRKGASEKLPLLIGAPLALVAVGAFAWTMMGRPADAPPADTVAVAQTAPAPMPLTEPAPMPTPQPVVAPIQVAEASPAPVARTAPARRAAAPARRAAPVSAPDAASASANVSATVPTPTPSVAEPPPLVIPAPVAPQPEPTPPVAPM